MLDPNRVYMLAADHRWQWEEWCAKRSIPSSRIETAKALALEGFQRARARSPAARTWGALLLDEQYGGTTIRRAREAGVEVGTPAERAGAFPLEWASEPCDAALTGSFVKVLILYRSDQAVEIRDRQLAMLLELQTWCQRNGKPLVVEVLVSREKEDEEQFERQLRPAMVADAIRLAYSRDLVPEYWKIEGTIDPEGAATIDAAVRERSECRQILLGKAADLATIRQWFAAVRACPSAVGFAIGRSVFWEPSTRVLAGELTADRGADAIAENYLALIEAWEDAG